MRREYQYEKLIRLYLDGHTPNEIAEKLRKYNGADVRHSLRAGLRRLGWPPPRELITGWGTSDDSCSYRSETRAMIVDAIKRRRRGPLSPMRRARERRRKARQRKVRRSVARQRRRA